MQRLGTPLLCTALCMVAAACGGPREVAVHVLIPGADSVLAPVATLPIIALPYDRDSVLAAMEAAAPTPRPHSAALDSLFAEYRLPFATFAVSTDRAERLRDTLDRITRALDTIPRGDTAYQRLYQRFAEITDSVVTADREREAAERMLARARTSLVPPIESLRAEMRGWEDSTFRGYDTLVQNLAESKFRLPLSDTTGSSGWATLALQPGRWWIYVRSWDAHDPNREWYWNVPVTGDTVILDTTNGRRRPKY